MSYDDSSLDGYIDVKQRLAEFAAKHPEGSMQPADPDKPFEIIYLDEQRAQLFSDRYAKANWFKGYQPTCFIVYTAAAYRSPDDPRPGIGVAWEPFPGMTPYTHNSEIQNAETSAWGRAIVAALAADAGASADEVRSRRDEQSQDIAEGVPVPEAKARLVAVCEGDKERAKEVWGMLHYPDGKSERITAEQLDSVLALAGAIRSGGEPFGLDDPPDPAAEPSEVDDDREDETGEGVDDGE